ncbi:quinone oxidoreductase family protein [Micromonospora trifolii]|uniref:quinone oxidoreductase family protein n=1 Tax=Micromonospora trifolii TaxID=2911208 RepID=UPI003D2F01E4
MTSSDSTMRAAALRRYGVPEYDTFPVPRAAPPETDVVRVLAAAVNGVDRAIAAGKHFLSPPQLPVVVGRDGVGTTTDGRLVYFDGPVAPYGSMAEQTLVPTGSLIEVPAGADAAVAAALGNAGLAAWLPLSWRASLQPGETVAVLGAAGYVGSLAVQAARHLGAGAVIGVVRDAAQAEQVLRLGADQAVMTSGDRDLPDELRRAAGGGLDVIVDYLWGPAAVAALSSAATGARLVQVGTASDSELALPAEVLRSRNVDLRGYVSFHAPASLRAKTYQHLVELSMRGELEVGVERFPLTAIDAAWSYRSDRPARRPVVVMG